MSSFMSKFSVDKILGGSHCLVKTINLVIISMQCCCAGILGRLMPALTSKLQLRSLISCKSSADYRLQPGEPKYL